MLNKKEPKIDPSGTLKRMSNHELSSNHNRSFKKMLNKKEPKIDPSGTLKRMSNHELN